MDNRNAAQQLLAMATTKRNLREVGICKANRKGFVSVELALDNKSDRASFVRLIDGRLIC